LEHLDLRKSKPDSRSVTPRPAVGPGVLLEAVNLTLRTMERRTRYYRNLVIGVSLTILGSLTLALAFHAWRILVGWLGAPLGVTGFLYLDVQQLRGWRDQVLAMRDERGLNVAKLQLTLRALRYIPERTLRSMFATLDREVPGR